MISPENLESSIIKTFRDSGYRATPQRIAISRYILRNHEHPAAQKAYFEVKEDTCHSQSCDDLHYLQKS